MCWRKLITSEPPSLLTTLLPQGDSICSLSLCLYSLDSSYPAFPSSFSSLSFLISLNPLSLKPHSPIIALSDFHSYPVSPPSSYSLPHLQNLHGLLLYIFPLQHHQVIRVSFNMVLSSLSTPSTSRCSRWPYPQPGTLLGRREPSWPTPWAWQSLKSRFEMDDYDHNSGALKNIRLNPKQNNNIGQPCLGQRIRVW